MVVIEDATRLGSGRLDRLDALGDMARGREARKPAVSEAAGSAKLRGGLATEPHLKRLLDGLGKDPSAGYGEALTVVINHLLLPQSSHER